MQNLRTRWITGWTIVAGALLATTVATRAMAAAPSQCIAKCHRETQAHVTSCVVQGNCARLYNTCRGNCVSDTMAGPERKACFTSCKEDRLSCRIDVAACKTECLNDFKDCRGECESN